MLGCSSRDRIKNSVNVNNIVPSEQGSISQSPRRTRTENKNQPLISRFQNSAVDAIRRYKRYAELGRDFSSNADVVAFYNDTVDRVAMLQDNKKRAKELKDAYTLQLEELISALNPDVSSSNIENQAFISELISILKDFSQFSKFNRFRQQGESESDEAFVVANHKLNIKHLILDRRRSLFIEALLNYLNQKDNTSELEALLSKPNQYQLVSSNQTLVLLHQIMLHSGETLKEKNIEDVCYVIKDKLKKLKSNPDVQDLVFEACGAEFRSEANAELALLNLLKNTRVMIDKKQSTYDAYVNDVLEEFEGNSQVIQYYIEDFFKQYHSNPSHTRDELIEMAHLAALKNHKPTLDRVRENLVNEILCGANVATFSLVSVVSVEGLSEAIGLFPPEYLHDQNESLINIVVRVIEVVAERAASYNDQEKRRLIIAIRSMVEGVAGSKSLERTQQISQSYANDIVTFMKEKIPQNPFRAYMVFQTWLKESTQAQAKGLLNIASGAAAATNHAAGITQEQRAKINQAVDKLHCLVVNQPRLFSYVHAGIKAEISNIPTQGEPTSLEQLLTTIWHTAMIAKSITLIVTSSGALLVREGMEMVDHLIALIPKPGEVPQVWNKYAKDLRALRAQASQLVNTQFSAQLIKYCIKLIESGTTTLNLEYEIYRSMSVALTTCDEQSINIKAVQMVAVLLKGEGFKKEDKDMRRQQALNMMLDFMTSSHANVVNEAYAQMKNLQTDYAMAVYNLVRNTWGNEHIRPVDLTTYNNRAKLGENTNHAQLAFDDEVKDKSIFEMSSLVGRARKDRFKFQDAIATLTREHKRLEQSNEGLYISVNGHNDPENMNSNEWVNIIGELWKFLENEKSAFILHGAMGTGKRAMVDHLVYLLLRYRRFGSLYPVRVHLKNLTGTDLLQHALQAEGWSQNRIDELRQRFSVKASSIATRQIPDPALPEILLIVIGVSAQDCPPQFMQHIKERWGREFKCMLVTGSGAFGLSDYANIFSSSLTQKQVREKVQEFYIHPQVTREQIAVTLSYDAATREYRNWMGMKPFLSSFNDYTLQEIDGVMGAQEDFPPAVSWVKKHYQCVFTDNAWLRDLATTPVMLRMLIRMVPKLFAGKRFQQAVSREDFLHVFIQTIFDEKLSHLKKNESNYHYSDKRSHHFFILYSRKAALHILRYRRSLYSYSDEAVMESSAKRHVMETDKVFFEATNSAARYGLLLSPLVSITEGQYEFINLELWVYFAIDGLYHEIIDCVHGKLTADSILNNTLLYDTRDVFRGLLNRVRSDARAQAALYKVVLATKTNKALDIAASNAMTLLVRMRSFSGNKELAGSSFSKANLNGGMFDFSCLDGVNMQKASIERCDFSYASVHLANVGHVKLREPDTYKMGESIAQAAFSEDGHVIVVASDTGSIACYRDKALDTEEAIFFLPGYRHGMSDRCKETNQMAAVANGWLEVWNIGTKASVVGPANIGELHGKAQALLFCQNGSKILLLSPSHALIYDLHQLKLGKTLNHPLFLLSKNDKWGFKLSYEGNMVAYFFYNSSTKTVCYRVTDVMTGLLVHEGPCPNSNGYSLTWVERHDVLLIQKNNQIILCDYRDRSNGVKTKYIQARRYEVDADRGVMIFLSENNTLERISLENFDVSSSEGLVEPCLDDFDRERKHVFLEKSFVEHIKQAVSTIKIQNEHVSIQCHALSSDKKHVILGVSEDNNWSVCTFNIDHQTWLPKIAIQSSWLELECIDVVRNKLIIYQNWKQLYVFDIDRSTRQPLIYNLYTDLNIDSQFGLMDFIIEPSAEGDGRSILLDLDTLKEIAVIPQEAGTVSLIASNPLAFKVQRAGMVYQLEINNEVVLCQAVQQSEEPDAAQHDGMVMAKDGNGLLAVAEKGGRLRLERHQSEGSINPMESRLYNVPDIVALHFIPNNKGSRDDTRELIVVCADGTIIYWDFDSNPQQDVIECGHDSKIISVVYSLAYEFTFTLDVKGKLLQWNKSGEGKVIFLSSHIKEMTVCPSGKHLYLFNLSEKIVSKFNINDMRAPVKIWSEVKQYCVMRRDGAFIYLTQAGNLFSERTRTNESMGECFETHQLSEQGKVIGINYLSEADKLVVNVVCNMRDLPIQATKLMVCSDSRLSAFDAEYYKKRACYSTVDASFMIARSVQGKYFMHKQTESPIEITPVMLKDVDKIKGIKLVADKIFVHYVDSSLRVWDYTQQKLSVEAIENVDDYFVCPAQSLLLVRQGTIISLYRASLRQDETPMLLPASNGNREIHEAHGCVWLNDITFASFHTNYAVKLWQVTADGCQQMNVLGLRRFYCKDMCGSGINISQILQYRLNMRGAKLNEVELVAHKQVNPLEAISETVDELKKQNQHLLSQMARLTLLFAQPSDASQGVSLRATSMPPLPPPK